MSKISIIGSGWLAQPLAQQLQVDGHQVTLTSTQSDKVQTLNDQGLNAIHYVLGEQLTEPNELFDTDIMIIAITSKDIDAFNLLMVQLQDHHCHHLIFISSTSVYQNNGHSHDEESLLLNHDNPLVTIERLIQQHPSATIIRFAGLIGPDRHPGHFFINGRTLKNPHAPVNLIHLDDCIGLIKTVIKKQAWNEVFNGSADTHPTKIEFYGTMAEQSGNEIPHTETDSNSSCKTIDNQKIKTSLSYELIHPDLMAIKFN